MGQEGDHVLSSTIPSQKLFSREKIIRFLKKDYDSVKDVYPRVEQLKKSASSGALEKWVGENGLLFNAGGQFNTGVKQGKNMPSVINYNPAKGGSSIDPVTGKVKTRTIEQEIFGWLPKDQRINTISRIPFAEGISPKMNRIDDLKSTKGYYNAEVPGFARLDMHEAYMQQLAEKEIKEEARIQKIKDANVVRASKAISKYPHMKVTEQFDNQLPIIQVTDPTTGTLTKFSYGKNPGDDYARSNIIRSDRAEGIDVNDPNFKGGANRNFDAITNFTKSQRGKVKEIDSAFDQVRIGTGKTPWEQVVNSYPQLKQRLKEGLKTSGTFQIGTDLIQFKSLSQLKKGVNEWVKNNGQKSFDNWREANLGFNDRNMILSGTSSGEYFALSDVRTKILDKKDRSYYTDSQVGFANEGFVPNFALDPLSDAIRRERSAGVPVSRIRVERSPRLANEKNPMGLAVTNTRDEPRGVNQGINRAISMGLDPKTHGLAPNGIIPNFSKKSISNDTTDIKNYNAGDVSNIKEGDTTDVKSYDAGDVSSIINNEFFQNKSLPRYEEVDSSTLQNKNISSARQIEYNNRLSNNSSPKYSILNRTGKTGSLQSSVDILKYDGQVPNFINIIKSAQQKTRDLLHAPHNKELLKELKTLQSKQVKITKEKRELKPLRLSRPMEYNKKINDLTVQDNTIHEQIKKVYEKMGFPPLGTGGFSEGVVPNFININPVYKNINKTQSPSALTAVSKERMPALLGNKFSENKFINDLLVKASKGKLSENQVMSAVEKYAYTINPKTDPERWLKASKEIGFTKKDAKTGKIIPAGDPGDLMGTLIKDMMYNERLYAKIRENDYLRNKFQYDESYKIVDKLNKKHGYAFGKVPDFIPNFAKVQQGIDKQTGGRSENKPFQDDSKNVVDLTPFTSTDFSMLIPRKHGGSSFGSTTRTSGPYAKKYQTMFKVGWNTKGLHPEISQNAESVANVANQLEGSIMQTMTSYAKSFVSTFGDPKIKYTGKGVESEVQKHINKGSLKAIAGNAFEAAANVAFQNAPVKAGGGDFDIRGPSQRMREIFNWPPAHGFIGDYKRGTGGDIRQSMADKILKELDYRGLLTGQVAKNDEDFDKYDKDKAQASREKTMQNFGRLGAATTIRGNKIYQKDPVTGKKTHTGDHERISLGGHVRFSPAARAAQFEDEKKLLYSDGKVPNFNVVPRRNALSPSERVRRHGQAISPSLDPNTVERMSNVVDSYLINKKLESLAISRSQRYNRNVPMRAWDEAVEAVKRIRFLRQQKAATSNEQKVKQIDSQILEKTEVANRFLRSQGLREIPKSGSFGIGDDSYELSYINRVRPNVSSQGVANNALGENTIPNFAKGGVSAPYGMADPESVAPAIRYAEGVIPNFNVLSRRNAVARHGQATSPSLDPNIVERMKDIVDRYLLSKKLISPSEKVGRYVQAPSASLDPNVVARTKNIIDSYLLDKKLISSRRTTLSPSEKVGRQGQATTPSLDPNVVERTMPSLDPNVVERMANIVDSYLINKKLESLAISRSQRYNRNAPMRAWDEAVEAVKRIRFLRQQKAATSNEQKVNQIDSQILEKTEVANKFLRSRNLREIPKPGSSGVGGDFDELSYIMEARPNVSSQGIANNALGENTIPNFALAVENAFRARAHGRNLQAKKIEEKLWTDQDERKLLSYLERSEFSGQLQSAVTKFRNDVGETINFSSPQSFQNQALRPLKGKDEDLRQFFNHKSFTKDMRKGFESNYVNISDKASKSSTTSRLSMSEFNEFTELLKRKYAKGGVSAPYGMADPGSVAPAIRYAEGAIPNFNITPDSSLLATERASKKAIQSNTEKSKKYSLGVVPNFSFPWLKKRLKSRWQEAAKKAPLNEDGSRKDIYRNHTGSLSKMGPYQYKVHNSGNKKITTITKDGKETENFAKNGDVIVSGPSGEQYVISPENFKKKYVGDVGGDMLPRGEKRMVAKITKDDLVDPKTGEVVNEIPVPWGTSKITPGDLVVLDPPGMYRVAYREAKQTYDIPNFALAVENAFRARAHGRNLQAKKIEEKLWTDQDERKLLSYLERSEFSGQLQSAVTKFRNDVGETINFSSPQSFQNQALRPLKGKDEDLRQFFNHKSFTKDMRKGFESNYVNISDKASKSSTTSRLSMSEFNEFTELLKRKYAKGGVSAPYGMADPGSVAPAIRYAEGAIPNFSSQRSGLGQALGREYKALKSRGVSNPRSKIKVSKSSRLKNSKNPLGLGVINTIDEPRGINQGINRAIKMGVNPHSHGIGSSGAFPSFAPIADGNIPNFAFGLGRIFGRSKITDPLLTAGTVAAGGASTKETKPDASMGMGGGNLQMGVMMLPMVMGGGQWGEEGSTQRAMGNSLNTGAMAASTMAMISPKGKNMLGAGIAGTAYGALSNYGSSSDAVVKSLQKEIAAKKRLMESSDSLIKSQENLNAAIASGDVDRITKSLESFQDVLYDFPTNLEGGDNLKNQLISANGDIEKMTEALGVFQKEARRFSEIGQIKLEVAQAQGKEGREGLIFGFGPTQLPDFLGGAKGDLKEESSLSLEASGSSIIKSLKFDSKNIDELMGAINSSGDSVNDLRNSLVQFAQGLDKDAKGAFLDVLKAIPDDGLRSFVKGMEEMGASVKINEDVANAVGKANSALATLTSKVKGLTSAVGTSLSDLDKGIKHSFAMAENTFKAELDIMEGLNMITPEQKRESSFQFEVTKMNARTGSATELKVQEYIDSQLAGDKVSDITKDGSVFEGSLGKLLKSMESRANDPGEDIRFNAADVLSEISAIPEADRTDDQNKLIEEVRKLNDANKQQIDLLRQQNEISSRQEALAQRMQLENTQLDYGDIAPTMGKFGSFTKEPSNTIIGKDMEARATQDVAKLIKSMFGETEALNKLERDAGEQVAVGNVMRTVIPLLQSQGMKYDGPGFFDQAPENFGMSDMITILERAIYQNSSSGSEQQIVALQAIVQGLRRQEAELAKTPTNPREAEARSVELTAQALGIDLSKLGFTKVGPGGREEVDLSKLDFSALTRIADELGDQGTQIKLLQGIEIAVKDLPEKLGQRLEGISTSSSDQINNLRVEDKIRIKEKESAQSKSSDAKSTIQSIAAGPVGVSSSSGVKVSAPAVNMEAGEISIPEITIPSAGGAVPGFAPTPLQRAIETERKMGGKPVVDSHPSLKMFNSEGKFVRDGSIQKNF